MMVAAADQPDREPDKGTDPSVLAERRARRAELAEGELRARLADAEQRVAQLEHGAHESARLRERLAARAERDARMAALVADAAATLRAAREALDREIAARGVAEAALHAERAAREAAEQAVVAERAARDAATSALTAERARVVPVPASLPLPEPPPAAARVGRRGRVAAARGAPDPQPGAPDNEQLIAGLALAAERLRAQAPAGRGEPAPSPRPPSRRPPRPSPWPPAPETTPRRPPRPRRRSPGRRVPAGSSSASAACYASLSAQRRSARSGNDARGPSARRLTSGARDRPVLRPSARPLRVLAARRRLQHRRARRARRGVRPARARR